MRATIYKQAYDDDMGDVDISKSDLEYGFAHYDCPDCDGTGVFEVYDDDSFTCVACKGTGKRWITL